MEAIETKEVAVVKQQATKALGAAQALNITTPEERISATDLLSKMKTVAKMIKAQKESVTKPLMEALDNARGLFKPVEANLAEGEALVKRKMLDWDAEVDRKAEEERARLAKRVEKGTMKPETAVAKMEDIQAAPTNVQGKVGATQTKIIRKVRITPVMEVKMDAAQVTYCIMKGYLVWDESLVRRDALAGNPIPGAEVYEEKVISAR